MPAFFLELFSEEIPARMQRGAAAELERLVGSALAPLSPREVRTWFGPRRLALAAETEAEIAAASSTERGPRASAPEQALTGFLRKHGATRDQLRQEGDYWVLEKRAAAVSAATLIAGTMPGLLRRFPWPKSMRWGGTSHFVWVRPLRRITCLLDGMVVPFALAEGGPEGGSGSSPGSGPASGPGGAPGGGDDAHGLASADLTEGHRFHAPGAFPVSGVRDWQEKLAARRVVVDAAERKRIIAEGIARLAQARGLTVVDDPGLLEEVAGLVEWPVPLLGRIADAHMDLPPEVMQVSMRVNQRYFSLRGADGQAAPWFAFVANVEAEDGGATIIAGNERVLRARFSDAWHFWDLDRKARLDTRVAALDTVTFHAKLGTEGQRVARLERLAGMVAPAVGAEPALAERGARLAKADLVTGMVGEFPELQGVMGRYYALRDGEDPRVADAVRDHYTPKGPGDAVPAAPVSIAVALADKLDQLAGFFAIGERPTGSGDPFALRRAALGVIRIIRENRLRLRLLPLIEAAGAGFDGSGVIPVPPAEILEFLAERLRIQLRAEGARHDVLAAVFAAGADDDLTRLLARAEAVTTLLAGPVGADLLTAYRRAANILRIEERKDGPFDQPPDPALLREPAERDLHRALSIGAEVEELMRREDYAGVMGMMAELRGPLDAFFTYVTVNAPEPELRRNRLSLLHQVRKTLDLVADFSRVEG